MQKFDVATVMLHALRCESMEQLVVLTEQAHAELELGRDRAHDTHCKPGLLCRKDTLRAHQWLGTQQG